jgi:hypothetical protein
MRIVLLLELSWLVWRFHVACYNEIPLHLCALLYLRYRPDLQEKLISQIYSGPSQFVFNQSFSQTAANDLCYIHSHGVCVCGGGRWFYATSYLSQSQAGGWLAAEPSFLAYSWIWISHTHTHIHSLAGILRLFLFANFPNPRLTISRAHGSKLID